jgi:hypothetical protein
MTDQKDIKKFLRLAIECIGEKMQRLSFDANLYEKGLSETPNSRRSHERYTELAKAMEYLEELQRGITGLPLFDR